MVTDGEDLMSPLQAARRLGFSTLHVVRLIQSGELPVADPGETNGWQIPAASVLAFARRRETARRQADEQSRTLDQLGAPLE